MPIIRAVAVVLAVLLTVDATIASPTGAQAPRRDVGTPASPAAPRTAHAIPVPSASAAQAGTSILVDGKLDDAAWASAAPITAFRQFDPDAGQPATERIEVRFLFDNVALYVGARLYDHLGAAGVTRTIVRRDAAFNSDFFEVTIDGFHDHLGRAVFSVNPAGSRMDMLGAGASCCDAGWDPVWEAATTVGGDGWTAELRIPFSQLRFSRDSVQEWGLQVRRYIQRRHELDQWAWWGRTENGAANRFGHLEGIHIAHGGSALELTPYAMTKSANVRATPGDPFNDGSKQSSRAGLDLKYLLTPNLTLDATINPDFGQVEVDPAVVNLSAFETFYAEKRPFFVSGSGVFSYGSIPCNFCSNVSGLLAFYSRRIGRAPTGADLAYAQGPYADIPEASSILGAAKVTGRTSGGYTVGVLDAVTGRATADVQRLDGSRATQEVEPLANYFVGRVKKDLMHGDLVLGAIGTSVVRDLNAQFAPRLSRSAELLGTDWQYAWNNRAYSFMGNIAVSSLEGDSRVMLARQQSSARFYQRPDRRPGSSGFFSTRLDSTATSMRGYGGYARLAKDGGDWIWETAVNFRSPGFETNDYSFLTSADYVWNNANLFRTWSTPTRWYRALAFGGGLQVQHNFDGDITTNSDAHLYFGGTTTGFVVWQTFYIWRPAGVVDDRVLRGGPAVRSPRVGYWSGKVTSDSRKQWQLIANPSFTRLGDGGWGSNLLLSAAFQPSTRVYVSLGPSYNNAQGKRQYVRAVADPTATAFNGTRYVLSDIRQKQLGLDTRLNVTFSPTMTLELYAQPFFVSAHYARFKEFAAPRRGDVTVFGQDRGTVAATLDAGGHATSYTIDPDGSGPAAAFTLQNPDFNLRSLRGSAVFRWEYRPGSSLYVAWTQQRRDQAAFGDFDLARDQQALFDSRPDNVLLVKASWYLYR